MIRGSLLASLSASSTLERKSILRQAHLKNTVQCTDKWSAQNQLKVKAKKDGKRDIP